MSERDALAADMTGYFTARAAQGLQRGMGEPACNDVHGQGRRDDLRRHRAIHRHDGERAADISKPNEAYFARIDAMLSSAGKSGIVVFLDPSRLGFLDTLRSNGMSAARVYGRYLGRRYAAVDNVLWMSGNDFRAWQSSSDDALVRRSRSDRGPRYASLQSLEARLPTYMSSLDDTTWTSILGITSPTPTTPRMRSYTSTTTAQITYPM